MTMNIMIMIIITTTIMIMILDNDIDTNQLASTAGVDGAVCDELDGPSPRSRLASSTPSGYPVTPQTSALSARSPMLPKCWRIMYQVLDLYSSLPKEAKVKGFMRRSIFGTTLYTGIERAPIVTCEE